MKEPGDGTACFRVLAAGTMVKFLDFSGECRLMYAPMLAPIMSRRHFLLGVCLLTAGVVLLPSRVPVSAQVAEAPAVTAETPGLVAARPAAGQFVETELGFMVPYTYTIPGTEIQFEMLPLPGGTFRMGSPAAEAEREEDEGPQSEVRVEPFWMGKHEVTWNEYQHFMQLYDLFKDFESRGVRSVTDDNRADAITAPTPLYDATFTFLLGEEPTQPAVTMSHYAARQYTKWLSLLTEQVYRLPTEAEWEYACRAGSTTAYSFGDDPAGLDEYAWYYDNADESYHDVGTKKPNAWGLHDMHGNVAEIVLDQYQADVYQTLASKPQTVESAVNWTTKMFPHVIRGGSWMTEAAGVRSASRAETEDWREEDPNLPKSPWWFTDEPALSVGFRICRPLRRPTAEFLKKAWEIDNPTLEQAVDGRLTEGRGALGLVDPQLADETP
jgi:formylglycine-generating enzyme required for sulfatase activity